MVIIFKFPVKMLVIIILEERAQHVPLVLPMGNANIAVLQSTLRVIYHVHAWSCPHFKCIKLYYEICDRLVCDKCCGKTLACGHRCSGVCGEPCLTICPLCHGKKFKKKLELATFNEGNLYEHLDKKFLSNLRVNKFYP